MTFDPYFIINNIDVLVDGAAMTVFVSGLSILLGVVLGMLMSFALISQNPLIRAAARCYVSFFRGTPLLTQLLLAFYVLPPLVGLDAPPLAAAIFAITLNTTAFQAEIYRGGLAVIPPGQMEAARMLGMSIWQARRRIIVPQLLFRVLPSIVNEITIIVKNSSLVSVIAVTELMRVSQQLAAAAFRPAEAYLAAAIGYMIITTCITFAGSVIERRLASRG
jgi:polar amino acid transport system permease protein